VNDESLPLKLGQRGPRVRELHHRLAQADFSAGNGETFTGSTRDAVLAFQLSRGLDPDGECGRQTWGALDEAAHRLGDRLLYLQRPMLRGDDVAELQRRLGALGFDAGRVDGILGPDSAGALENFQRNAGLPTDAIFGPDSLAALNRLGSRDDQQPVTTVRERERLRQSAGRSGEHSVVLSEPGGLGTIIDTVARRLRARGLRVETILHPDGSHHARLANQLEVDLCLGLRTDDVERATISYFASAGFSSEGGAHLASLIALRCTNQLGGVEVVGRRLPVLRETRMPAVDIRIGPAERLVASSAGLANSIADAVVTWLAEPVPGADEHL
jgi:N-acetylmuramoyl-L-alanine amidase